MLDIKNIISTKCGFKLWKQFNELGVAAHLKYSSLICIYTYINLNLPPLFQERRMCKDLFLSVRGVFFCCIYTYLYSMLYNTNIYTMHSYIMLYKAGTINAKLFLVYIRDRIIFSFQRVITTFLLYTEISFDKKALKGCHKIAYVRLMTSILYAIRRRRNSYSHLFHGTHWTHIETN